MTEHILTQWEQETLKNVDIELYNTTHDPKNKEVLPIAIFWSVICIIFNGAMLWECIVWGIYYMYCDSNNKKWSNLPCNIRERESLLKFRQKLINGEIKRPLSR